MDISNSANVNTAYRNDGRPGRGKVLRSNHPSLSTAISEALYEPKVLERPAALACRVKNAGKEFLRHNQTCQWIQNMLEENPTPPRPRPTKKAVPREPLPPKPSPPLSDIDQFSIPDVTQTDNAMGHYEEQLKRLQKQQEELMDQQRRLQQQIEEQKKAHQLAMQHQALQRQNKGVGGEQLASRQTSKSSVTSIVNSDGLYTPPTPNRRRLKGNLAQNCAIRDEGSIGSLLWHSGESEFSDRSSDKTASIMDHAVYANTTMEGRQIATSQESGTTVSQLLSHWPSDSCTEVSKNMSEISDTLLTDSTVKEQDDCTNTFYNNNTMASLSSFTNDNTLSTTL